jgi:hypothetical protein
LRIALALVVLVGCRQVLGIDDPIQPPADASNNNKVDAPPVDGSPMPLCTFIAAANPMAGSSLGGTSGSQQSDLVCPKGSLPIGIGLSITANLQPEGGGNAGEVLVAGIGVQCGTVGVAVDGGSVVTPTMLMTFMAMGNCAGWTPVTLQSVVRCPPGSVLVGLNANGGSLSLFNSVSLVCEVVDGNGNIGGDVTILPVGMPTNSNRPETATCPQDMAVVQFGLQANCGIDELTPQCAPLVCQ